MVSLNKRIMDIALLIVFFAMVPGSKICNIALSREAMDHNTLVGRHIVGYQGWFRCPSASDNGIWRKWFRGSIRGGATVDMWPDVSELKSSDKCPTELFDSAGNRLFVFSSLNLNVVNLHFKWMKNYDIDTAAVQRFVAGLKKPKDLEEYNVVLDNVVRSASQYDRSFYIMYDISSANPQTWYEDLLNDWREINRKGIVNLRNYLRHNGKPVLAIWGLGVPGRPTDPALALDLVKKVKSESAGFDAVTIIGGVPRNFRDMIVQDDGHNGWLNLFESLDYISPWYVGSILNEDQIAKFVQNQVSKDLDWAQQRSIGFIPVIYPGFSWANLQRDHNKLNFIKRDCGRFYERLALAYISAGSKILYTAMFDEVDEGTAIFKTIAHKENLPIEFPAISLAEEGCAIKSDFYLEIAAKISHALRASQSSYGRKH